MKKVIQDVAKVLASEPTEERIEAVRESASKFVDRVQAVFNKHVEDGCVQSDFTPHFNLDEADLLDFTLYTLWTRNVLTREIRYFLRPTK